MKGCANTSLCARGAFRQDGTILGNGFSDSMVSRGWLGSRSAGVAAPAPQTQNHAAAVQLADVLREADAELDQAPPPALPAPVCAADAAGALAGAGLCASFCAPAGAGRQS